jgi:hypothetical protein
MRPSASLVRILLVTVLTAAACVFIPQAPANTKAAAGSCPSGNNAIVNPTLTVVQGGTATATFKIARYCSNIQVNLASYDAPEFNFALPQTLIDYNPKPLNGPTRYSYNNGATYALTANVSPCFFQVDLVRGPVIVNLTEQNQYGSRKLRWQNGGTKCVTKITTTAKPEGGVDIGGAISDTAVLSGLSAAGGGTLTFKVYGPNDATCSTVPKSTSTVNVSGSNTYSSASYTPTAPGTYRWTASYSGDSRNFPAVSGCNAANESVVVRPRSPTITTNASANVNLGGSVWDTATLGGTLNGTGTITFKLWSSAACTGLPVFTSVVTVSGNAAYTSGSFTPTSAGTYHWIASYSGDANNLAVSGKCGDADESVTVFRLGPSLTTQASADVSLGNPISDTATLSGTASGTGTITFDLFGPNNSTCSGAPIFTSSTSVAGNGSYNSGSFTPTQAGTYRWVARYSGDVNNLPAPTSCNDAGESVTVGEDDSEPFCVLTQTVPGPPKQLKITVQDPESGISSIVVDAIVNATTTGDTGFPAGTTSPVVVTASKTNQSKSSFIRLKVTNNAGLTTFCDPVVPAVKKSRRGAVRRQVAGSKFAFKANARRVTFGAERGVLLSGTIPGARAGQRVTVLGQACGFTGPSKLASVKTSKGGAFRFSLLPGLNATYSVRWGSVTKKVSVSVRPQVALVRESAGRFRVDVSTTNGMFLTSSQVQLQRWSGRKWIGIRTTTLSKNSREDAMIAVSSGTLAASVFGRLRAVLPASKCYAGGVSPVISG